MGVPCIMQATLAWTSCWQICAGAGKVEVKSGTSASKCRTHFLPVNDLTGWLVRTRNPRTVTLTGNGAVSRDNGLSRFESARNDLACRPENSCSVLSKEPKSLYLVFGLGVMHSPICHPQSVDRSSTYSRRDERKQRWPTKRITPMTLRMFLSRFIDQFLKMLNLLSAGKCQLTGCQWSCALRLSEVRCKIMTTQSFKVKQDTFHLATV
jgi:hypothetical protein